MKKIVLAQNVDARGLVRLNVGCCKLPPKTRPQTAKTAAPLLTTKMAKIISSTPSDRELTSSRPTPGEDKGSSNSNQAVWGILTFAVIACLIIFAICKIRNRGNSNRDRNEAYERANSNEVVVTEQNITKQHVEFEKEKGEVRANKITLYRLLLCIRSKK